MLGTQPTLGINFGQGFMKHSVFTNTKICNVLKMSLVFELPMSISNEK